MKQVERFQVYAIPHNFIDSGKALGGMVNFRNLVEGVALALPPIFPVIRYCPGGLDTKAAIIMLICIPLFIFGCVGINGDSISEFLIYYIQFFRKKRIVQYNPRVKTEAIPFQVGIQSELPKERLIRMFGDLFGNREVEDDETLEDIETEQFFDDDIGVLLDVPPSWKDRIQEWFHSLFGLFWKRGENEKKNYAEYLVETRKYAEYVSETKKEDNP